MMAAREVTIVDARTAENIGNVGREIIFRIPALRRALIIKTNFLGRAEFLDFSGYFFSEKITGLRWRSDFAIHF